MDPETVERISKELSIAFAKTGQVRRALERTYGIHRIGYVRHHVEDRIHFWLVPDFAGGRSRILAISSAALLEYEMEDIGDALDQAGWAERLEKASLLVDVDDHGLTVSEVEPDLPEAWFPDPKGGYFFVYPSRGFSMVPQPAHLGLYAESWTARGPDHPRDPRDCSLEELQPFIPASVQNAQG